VAGDAHLVDTVLPGGADEARGHGGGSGDHGSAVCRRSMRAVAVGWGSLLESMVCFTAMIYKHRTSIYTTSQGLDGLDENTYITPVLSYTRDLRRTTPRRRILGFGLAQTDALYLACYISTVL
jgi:hypothetical protein